MSRPPVRKTENVKTAPVIGMIGGVFGRLQGKGRGFPVGAGPAGRILAFCSVGNPARPRKKGLPKPGQYAILSKDANTKERSC